MSVKKVDYNKEQCADVKAWLNRGRVLSRDIDRVKLKKKKQGLGGLFSRRSIVTSEISTAINKLKNATHRAIIRDRYVFFLKWEIIAHRNNSSKSRVQALHREALTEMQKIYERRLTKK